MLVSDLPLWEDLKDDLRERAALSSRSFFQKGGAVYHQEAVKAGSPHRGIGGEHQDRAEGCARGWTRRTCRFSNFTSQPPH